MPLVKKKISPTKTREILLQALYQKEISDISNTNLINQFKKAYREFDISNVAENLRGINKNNDSLNKSIADNSLKAGLFGNFQMMLALAGHLR